MKATKAVILFLVLCLTLCATLCMSVAAEDAAADAGSKLSTGALVSLIIGGVLIVVVIVLCIVKREKLKESLRAYRSEMKKITWFPKKQVWASTLFVIVISIAVAVVVGLLDYAFFEGQNWLVKNFTFFGGI